MQAYWRNVRYELAPPCTPRRIERWERSLHTIDPSLTIPPALREYLLHVSSQLPVGAFHNEWVTCVSQKTIPSESFCKKKTEPKDVYITIATNIVCNITSGKVEASGVEYPTFKAFILCMLEEFETLKRQGTPCQCPRPQPLGIRSYTGPYMAQMTIRHA